MPSSGGATGGGRGTPVHDLIARAQHCDAIDRCHHSLLHQLAVHLRQHALRELVPLARIVRNHLPHHRRDACVDILGRWAIKQAHGARARDVAPNRGVVLQPIAAAILMDWQGRLERGDVAAVEGGLELHARCQNRPRRLAGEPPAAARERCGRRVEGVRKLLERPGDAVVERALVDYTVEVGEVDEEPPEATVAKGARVGEREEPAAKVVAKVA